MNYQIEFSSGLCIQTLFRQDIWIGSLRSFIQEVAIEVEQHRNLNIAISKAAQNYPKVADCFYNESTQIDSETFLREEYLFPQHDPLKLVLFTDRQNETLVNFGIPNESILPQLHQLLYRCRSKTQSKKEICDNLDISLQNLLERLLAHNMINETRSTNLQSTTQMSPGIYRLQHASLFYRTKTTSILVDPHFYSIFEQGLTKSERTFIPSDLEENIDAILISHSHKDHFHLPTLMMFPRETLIVVPKVPRSTILCEDMQKRLYDLGFTNVVTVDWYSDPLVIGDIEVHVLPFYGEQPLLYDSLTYADIRNWGNTYLLKTENHTSWLLIDSGNDALGNTVEVANYVKQKFGKIDFLLSNLREFFVGFHGEELSPFYTTGSGHCWLSLSTQQIINFSSMKKHCITLGAEGVAEICQIVAARYFLPYAHWWNSLGNSGEHELLLLLKLEQALKDRGCPTLILPWKIGECCTALGNRQFKRDNTWLELITKN